MAQRHGGFPNEETQHFYDSLSGKKIKGSEIGGWDINLHFEGIADNKLLSWVKSDPMAVDFEKVDLEAVLERMREATNARGDRMFPEERIVEIFNRLDFNNCDLSPAAYDKAAKLSETLDGFEPLNLDRARVVIPEVTGLFGRPIDLSPDAHGPIRLGDMDEKGINALAAHFKELVDLHSEHQADKTGATIEFIERLDFNNCTLTREQRFMFEDQLKAMYDQLTAAVDASIPADQRADYHQKVIDWGDDLAARTFLKPEVFAEKFHDDPTRAMHAFVQGTIATLEHPEDVQSWRFTRHRDVGNIDMEEALVRIATELKRDGREDLIGNITFEGYAMDSNQEEQIKRAQARIEKETGVACNVHFDEQSHVYNAPLKWMMDKIQHKVEEIGQAIGDALQTFGHNLKADFINGVTGIEHRQRRESDRTLPEVHGTLTFGDRTMAAAQAL